MQKKLRLGDHTLCQGRLDSLDCHCSDTESEAGDTLEVIQVTMVENIRNGNYRRDIYCVAALIVLVLSIAFSGRPVKVMRTRTANSDADSSLNDPSKSGGNNKFYQMNLDVGEWRSVGYSAVCRTTKKY